MKIVSLSVIDCQQNGSMQIRCSAKDYAEWRANCQWDIFFSIGWRVLIYSKNHCDPPGDQNPLFHMTNRTQKYNTGKEGEKLDTHLDLHLFVFKAQRGADDSVDLLRNLSGNSAEPSLSWLYFNTQRHSETPAVSEAFTTDTGQLFRETCMNWSGPLYHIPEWNIPLKSVIAACLLMYLFVFSLSVLLSSH